MKTNRTFIIPFLLSILLHFIVSDVLNWSGISSLLNRDSSVTNRNSKLIEVTSVDPEELKKIRTVGLLDGKKNAFSEQVPLATPAIKPSEKIAQVNSPKKSSTPTKKIEPHVGRADKNRVVDEDGTVVLFAPSEIKDLNPNVLKDLAIGSNGATGLRGANFNIHFEPPEGVTEDELNTSEKIYYSFQKRTFKSYISSFISTYNDISQRKPSLSRVTPGRQTLTGKITFDKDGNILAIKILRWSDQDEIQELFEKTLENIKTLPNPPKSLVEKSGEFTIYYQLNISG